MTSSISQMNAISGGVRPGGWLKAIVFVSASSVGCVLYSLLVLKREGCQRSKEVISIQGETWQRKSTKYIMLKFY